jgi:hypothetical protein
MRRALVSALDAGLDGRLPALAQVSVGRRHRASRSETSGSTCPLYSAIRPGAGLPGLLRHRSCIRTIFFYDGMYWVYSDDNWYASSWYKRALAAGRPEVVPVFLLRVPVRYYPCPADSISHAWRREARLAGRALGPSMGTATAADATGVDSPLRPGSAPGPAGSISGSNQVRRYPRAVEQLQAAGAPARGPATTTKPRDKPVVRQHYQGTRARGTPDFAAGTPGKRPGGQSQSGGTAAERRRRRRAERSAGTSNARVRRPATAGRDSPRVRSKRQGQVLRALRKARVPEASRRSFRAGQGIERVAERTRNDGIRSGKIDAPRPPLWQRSTPHNAKVVMT